MSTGCGSGCGEGFDESVERAWLGFEERVAGELRQMGEGSWCVSVTGEPKDGGCLPYLQFAGDDELVLAEVSGNEFLEESLALDAGQHETLQALGWSPPDGEHRPNWWCEVPHDQVDLLRSMVSETFQLVFSVVHPQFLESSRPGLVREDDAAAEPEPSLVLGFPDSSEDLTELIERALTPVFGPEIQRDPDGDFPICAGVVPLWIRVHGDRPAVRVFSHVVCGVQNTGQVAVELGILNRRTPLVKFYASGDVVLAAVDLPAMPFVGAQLLRTLEEVHDLLNDLAPDLALRVDGHLFFDGLSPSDLEDSA